MSVAVLLHRSRLVLEFWVDSIDDETDSLTTCASRPPLGRRAGIDIGSDRMEILQEVRPSRRSRSGRPRFGWESLSETELVVADLAARGRTNREIADELIMSPHTLDFHVRHIYRKPEISSRIDLTRTVLANDRTVQR